MGCQDNKQCNYSAVAATGIIGRSIQTRQQNSCHECCGTNLCNNHLCAYKKPSACTDDETPDCARLNTIFNVCADIHHAQITCPKFCGLCQLVDGSWTDWGTWTPCSVTCENGKQSRTRTCENPPPSNGGLNCIGSAFESQLCTKPLCPVNGDWSAWSVWSSCSVTCDGGLQKRSRYCTNPKPNALGDYCVGDNSEYSVCQNQPCVSPVHGNWSAWSLWSTCSGTCDGGLQKRSRTCTNPKRNTLGDDCVGNNLEYSICLNDPCGARNGGWSSWGSWQTCSVTCGGGLKLKGRTCTNPSPSAYGKTCDGNSETFAVCVKTPCNVVAFNAHGRNVLSNLVNAFQTVIFNEGNAYSASTGHFTAPVNGIYYFTAHICNQPRQNVAFRIEKGNASISSGTRLTATYEEHAPFYLCLSASTSVKLNRDEHVWVLMLRQYNDSSINEDYYTWNTFTGTLIQEL